MGHGSPNAVLTDGRSLPCTMLSRTCGSMHDMQQYQQWEADRNPRTWSYPRSPFGERPLGYTGGISLLFAFIDQLRAGRIDAGQHIKRALDSHMSFPWFSCHRTRVSTNRHIPPHRYFFSLLERGTVFVPREEPYPGQRLPSLAEPEVRLTPKAGMRLSAPGSCPGYPVPIKSGSLPRGLSVKREPPPWLLSGLQGEPSEPENKK
ncbi:hypothetical protein CP533_3242 [Ophiocordyceps camponoti-saundersi (nom. inval.)]|nr:hypothetical protein CP533_3242 [Ophiocordyceps camponoti-saundersi (nom. inval.)]